MSLSSSVSDNDFIRCVENILIYYKNHPIFGQLCQDALNSRSWVSIREINHMSSQVSTGKDKKKTHLIIIREYIMEEKLLMVPADANVLYAMYKFHGNIPPRPLNSSVVYEICYVLPFTQQSNDIIYRWSMPIMSGLFEKMTVGSTSKIKDMQAKGYDLRYAETYDPNKYVYDSNIVTGTSVGVKPKGEDEDIKLLYRQLESAHEEKNKMTFYRFVLEKLVENDHENTSKDLLNAIQKAVENIRDLMTSDREEDEFYYHCGQASVCIKKTFFNGNYLDLGKGDTLIIFDNMNVPLIYGGTNREYHTTVSAIISQNRYLSRVGKIYINNVIPTPTRLLNY